MSSEDRDRGMVVGCAVGVALDDLLGGSVAADAGVSFNAGICVSELVLNEPVDCDDLPASVGVGPMTGLPPRDTPFANILLSRCPSALPSCSPLACNAAPPSLGDVMMGLRASLFSGLLISMILFCLEGFM